MNVTLWAAELAKLFWSHVGAPEPFPRHLREPIRALPLTVEAMVQLTIAKVTQWLCRNASTQGLAICDRSLRGCLIAKCGHGIIFLDATDPEEEQRFTLAHELAHFLRDYWRPRQLTIRRLGRQAAEVLDGKRSATSQERLEALLSGMRLGFHVHLMERDVQRRPVDSESRDAEWCADRLACELLAPAEHVAALYRMAGGDHSPEALVKRLCQDYGLPKLEAVRYAGQLLGQSAPVEEWLVSLRKLLRR